MIEGVAAPTRMPPSRGEVVAAYAAVIVGSMVTIRLVGAVFGSQWGWFMCAPVGAGLGCCAGRYLAYRRTFLLERQFEENAAALRAATVDDPVLHQIVIVMEAAMRADIANPCCFHLHLDAGESCPCPNHMLTWLHPHGAPFEEPEGWDGSRPLQ